MLEHREPHLWFGKLRVRLGQGRDAESLQGSHSAYVEPDGTLVIDWYHFGPTAAYEFVRMARLANADKAHFRSAMGCPAKGGDVALLKAIERQFQSLFDVERFLQAQEIAYTITHDMWP